MSQQQRVGRNIFPKTEPVAEQVHSWHTRCMRSPERPSAEGEPPHELPAYHQTARYQNDRPAGKAYTKAQDPIYKRTVFCRAQFAKAVDTTVFPGVQGGPLMHVIAAKAVTLKLAAGEEFKTYQERTVENVRELAQHLMELGARVISGGSDTHLLLLDIAPLGVTGRDVEKLLDRVGITVNKNRPRSGPAVLARRGSRANRWRAG